MESKLRADLLGFSLPAPASKSAEFVQWPFHLPSVFGRINSLLYISFNACRSLIYKRWNIKSIQNLITTLFFVLANVDRMTGSSRRCLRRISTHHDSADCRRRVGCFRLIWRAIVLRLGCIPGKLLVYPSCKSWGVCNSINHAPLHRLDSPGIMIQDSLVCGDGQTLSNINLAWSTSRWHFLSIPRRREEKPKRSRPSLIATIRGSSDEVFPLFTPFQPFENWVKDVRCFWWPSVAPGSSSQRKLTIRGNITAVESPTKMMMPLSCKLKGCSTKPICNPWLSLLFQHWNERYLIGRSNQEHFPSNLTKVFELQQHVNVGFTCAGREQTF